MSPTVLLTAGHVLLGPGETVPAASDVVVELPWSGYQTLTAQGLQIHPTWLADQTKLLSDVALIHVAAVADVGLSVRALDTTGEASVYGYPLEAGDLARSSFQSGHLERRGDALYSRSFDLRGGISGSPFVQLTGIAPHVVGIATFDSDDPDEDALNGIPIDAPSVRSLWPIK